MCRELLGLSLNKDTRRHFRKEHLNSPSSATIKAAAAASLMKDRFQEARDEEGAEQLIVRRTMRRDDRRLCMTNEGQMTAGVTAASLHWGTRSRM